MGQANEAYAQRIGLPFTVESQNAFGDQILKDPVQRCLGIRRFLKNIVEAHRPLKRRHEVKHAQRFTHSPA